MRHQTYIFLGALLLATPAIAQTPANPAAPAPKPQAAKDAATAKSSQVTPPQATPVTPSAPAKDDSLTTYDVTGSNASDAMGASTH